MQSKFPRNDCFSRPNFAIAIGKQWNYCLSSSFNYSHRPNKKNNHRRQKQPTLLEVNYWNSDSSSCWNCFQFTWGRVESISNTETDDSEGESSSQSARKPVVPVRFRNWRRTTCTFPHADIFRRHQTHTHDATRNSFIRAIMRKVAPHRLLCLMCGRPGEGERDAKRNRAHLWKDEATARLTGWGLPRGKCWSRTTGLSPQTSLPPRKVHYWGRGIEETY